MHKPSPPTPRRASQPLVPANPPPPEKFQKGVAFNPLTKLQIKMDSPASSSGKLSNKKRRDPDKKRARLQFLGAGHIPGDDLLSQDLSSHYHWRCSVSLPGSEWDRVVPPRSGHQRSILFDQDWDSGEHIGCEHDTQDAFNFSEFPHSI
jgi:hypothetical protein